MLTQAAASLEYVKVPVSLRESGSYIDPTGDTVQLAFMAEGEDPDVTDWHTGTWETDSTTVPTTYFARCLVGPTGDVVLVAGIYDVWIRITDSPEAPVLKTGNIQIV